MPISRLRLDVARSAFFEELYRGRSVLCIGVGDGKALAVLVERGATRVVGVDGDARAAAAAARALGRHAEVSTGSAATVSGRFDVVMVAVGEALVTAPSELAAVRERIAPGGWLVATAPSRDRAGSETGVGYYQLRDALAPHFPSVTMVGEAPLEGATLAPLGDEEAGPTFDGELAEIEAHFYIAVAGPRRPQLGFGVVALPVAASDAIAVPDQARADEARGHAAELKRVRDEARAAEAEGKRLRDEALGHAAELKRVRDEARAADAEGKRLRDEAQAGRRARDEAQAALARVRDELETERRKSGERIARLERERGELHAAVATERRRADASLTVELTERLAAREQGIDELRDAAVRHAEEMRAVVAERDERDAYIAELEAGARAATEASAELARQRARVDEAEARERSARKRIAELEGTLLRVGAGGSPAPLLQLVAAPPPATAADPRIVELEARCQKLEGKAADAQREAWAHMKARSEAEAAAAEVREDTVRKLKDARKVANLDLMRAMEEATRKAVSLKEELTRTEAERRETLAALKGMREEHASLQAALEAARSRPQAAPPTVAVDDLRKELAVIAELLDGEGARLGGIEEGLRRAVAAVGAAEFDFGDGAR